MGVHARTGSDFLSNALRLPSVKREERMMREAAMEAIAFLQLDAVIGHPAAGLPFSGPIGAVRVALIDKGDGAFEWRDAEPFRFRCRASRDVGGEVGVDAARRFDRAAVRGLLPVFVDERHRGL